MNLVKCSSCGGDPCAADYSSVTEYSGFAYQTCYIECSVCDQQVWVDVNIDKPYGDSNKTEVLLIQLWNHINTP